MSKIVPIKNIDPALVDVKKPGLSYRSRPRLINLSNFSEEPFIIYRHRSFRLTFLIPIFFVIFLSFSVLTFFYYQDLKTDFEVKGHQVFNNFLASFQAFKNLEPFQAFSKLEENQKILKELSAIFDKFQNQKFIELAGFLLPPFKEATQFFSQIKNLNNQILEMSQILNDLKVNGFYYFRNDGQKLINQLKEIKDLIESSRINIEKIQKTTSFFKQIFPGFSSINNFITQQYLSFSPYFYKWKNFLENVIDLLNRKEDLHLLLIFQNPAEIRPTGGFIGSYADVVIRKGQLYFIDVRDIYDADGQLDLKVVPPEPLQVTNYNWQTRDANWFFDFPLSAQKILSFMESSKIYQEQNIKFDFVIAININVLKSLLALIGPIYLEEYNLTLDQNNLLKELQKEIESGQDKLAGYPKRILKILTPIILEKIETLSQKEREKLLEIFLTHLQEKDVMLFARNKSFQEFFVAQNMSGSVYELPSDFFGHYLAVVNANIEGGKSDAFIKQEIELEVGLNTDGSSFNNLIIRRIHEGDKEKEPWWRKINQNYLQIFVNPNASLIYLKGNSKPPSKYKEVNYEALNYLVDNDVKSFESKLFYSSQYQTWIGEIFGKTVFGTWLIIPPGEQKDLEVRYQIKPKSKFNFSSRIPYQFIYEKQSGVNSKLSLKLVAPYGYLWFESGQPVYYFEKDISEGRMILNLNLIRQSLKD